MKKIIKSLLLKLGLKTYNDIILGLITALSSLSGGVIIFFAKEIRGVIGSYFILGLSEGLFVLTIGFSTLFWGVVIDYVKQRKLVLFVALEITSAFIFLTSFSQNATEYLIYRTFTGLFLAIILPFLVSFVSDIHNAGERITMFMVFSMIGTIGTALGYTLSLFLRYFFNWRMILRIISILQSIASITAFILREPPRGAAEKYIAKLKAIKHDFILRLRKRDIISTIKIKTNILLFLQGFFGALPWGAFAMFFVHAIAEKMQTDMLYVSIFVGISNVTYFLAPKLAEFFDSIREKNKLDMLPLSAGFLTITYASLFQALININLPKINAQDVTAFFIELAHNLIRVPTVSIFISISLMFPLISAQVGPIVNNIIVDINTPDTRAYTRGLLTQIESIGRAFGLIMCGLLIDKYGSFSSALAVVSLFWFLSGLLWFLIIITYRKDFETIELRLIEKIHMTKGK